MKDFADRFVIGTDELFGPPGNPGKTPKSLSEAFVAMSFSMLSRFASDS